MKNSEAVMVLKELQRSAFLDGDDVEALQLAIEALQKTCVWTERRRYKVPKDMRGLIGDWAYYDSACGNFGLNKHGDYCHCGGRIIEPTPPEEA